MQCTFSANIEFFYCYSQIVVEVEKAKGLKKAIFNYAFKKKKSDVDKGIVKKTTLWDKLVFQKMQVGLLKPFIGWTYFDLKWNWFMLIHAFID